MSTPDPSSSACAPVWQLRFLICRSKSVGPQPVTLGGGVRRYTSLDPVHACQSYICKSAAEFEELQRQVVAKPEKSFFAAVELYNPDTKERRKITSDMRFTVISTPQDGKAVNSPGSYPGDAGSTPAPATISGMVPATDEAGNVVGMVGANACKFGFGILKRKTSDAEDSQTDEGTQSGGAEAPAVPESTPSAPDTDAGTSEAAPEPETAPAPQSGESESEASEPESSAPRSARVPAPEPKPDKEKGRQGDKETPKRKPGRPAKK